MPDVAYRVSIPNPETHRLTVTVDVRGHDATDAFVRMPRWAPGWYVLREYARNVEEIRAASARGRPLPVEVDGVNGWRVRLGRTRDFSVELTIHAEKWGDAFSWVDQEHASLFGPSVFPWVEGLAHLSAPVSFEYPERWARFSTALPAVAADYDHLIDCPIEIGNHEVHEFTAGGRPHELAVVGGPIGTDGARLVGDLGRIVETAGRMFGGLPYERYVFLLYVTSEPTGSLEHRDSTTFTMLPRCFTEETWYVNKWLATAAHEFFHLYNVKRIRPSELVPLDYTVEQPTELLWIFEGLTSYFDDRIVLRAGLTTEEGYREKLAKNVTLLRNAPGRLRQSLADSSLEAWTKFMAKDANFGNRGISFYTKGLLVGLCLDLAIRDGSAGKRGLEDVMRSVYADTKRHGYGGLTLRRFRALAEKEAGGPLPEIFETYLRTTEEVDFDRYFGLAGLFLAEDWPKKKPFEPGPKREGWLGLETETREGRVLVAKVPLETPALAAGFAPGDEIVFADGRRMESEEMLAERIRWAKPGDALPFTIARHGRPRDLVAEVGRRPATKWKIAERRNATARQRRLRKAWLA